MRHSSYLEVDLHLLGENVQAIKKLAPGASVIAMVKADAYGNGLLPVSRALSDNYGVKTLGCATLSEGVQLRKNLESEVFVFSDTELKDDALRRAYDDPGLIPVIHLKSDLEVALNCLPKVPLVLKLETGMNRLGLTLEDLEPFLPDLRSRGVRHLMTHFSCSYQDLKEKDKTHRQFELFNSMKKYLMDERVSIEETSVANSGAIEQGFGVVETHVRPGLMMYGPPSVMPQRWRGHQISRLVTKVLKTFCVKKGTPVGYGIFVAPEDLYMAILPVGYGDGILTYASGVNLTVNGIPGRIFGRVNMDMTFVAFDMSHEGKLKENDAVEIWNHDNRVINDIAEQMKTHAYQVMCAISSRVPRIYKI